MYFGIYRLEGHTVEALEHEEKLCTEVYMN